MNWHENQRGELAKTKHVYGHQMAAVNYGPVVTLIRDWRPAEYTHTTIYSSCWTQVGDLFTTSLEFSLKVSYKPMWWIFTTKLSNYKTNDIFQNYYVHFNSFLKKIINSLIIVTQYTMFILLLYIISDHHYEQLMDKCDI